MGTRPGTGGYLSCFFLAFIKPKVMRVFSVPFKVDFKHVDYLLGRVSMFI